MNLLPFRVLHVGGRGDIATIAPLYALGPNLELTVVEADPSAEPIQVPDILSGRVRVLACCLGNHAAPQEFHVTHNPQASSLYLMNPRFAHWTYNSVPWEQEAVLDHDIDVVTTTIDILRAEMKLQELHFLSLDAQGAEYEILWGAENTLRNDPIVGVVAEAGLANIYKGQGLFSQQLDTLLRE
ncbi:MAG: FkbM family methyltransferase, partial [Chloroflexota bacterium]|nr:FkbM family methyltransferase [Chloroflexota bacterium]